MRFLGVLLVLSVFSCGCGSPSDPLSAMKPKVEKIRTFLQDYCTKNFPSGVYPGGSPKSTGEPVYVDHNIIKRDDLVTPYVCNLKIVVKQHTKEGGYGDMGLDVKSDWDGQAWGTFYVVDEGIAPANDELFSGSPKEKADHLLLRNFNKKLLEDTKAFLESL